MSLKFPSRARQVIALKGSVPVVTWSTPAKTPVYGTSLPSWPTTLRSPFLLEDQATHGARGRVNPLTEELRKWVSTPKELPEDLLRAAETEDKARGPTLASVCACTGWARSWRAEGAQIGKWIMP